MAVSYVNRKCESCGSRKFVYNEKTKTWTCLYCGNTTEKEEKYDGLFTIKNVVKQTLLDVAFRRLCSAEKNLIECEKIDSKYVGTIISNLCFLMISATTPGEAGAQDKKNMFAKIKKYNENLQSENAIITDDEEQLYEFFESSNIYATLVLVFDSINDDKRCKYLEQLLNLEDIDSVETNKNLLSYSLKKQQFVIADKLIRNGNADKKFALSEILTKYPDNEQKISNAQTLFEQSALTKDDKGIVENYLSETTDFIQTKSKIFESSNVSGLKINTDIIITSLLEKTDDLEIVKSIFYQFCSSKLFDDDIYKIVNYCFNCKNVKITIAGLSALKESSQFITLEQKHIISLFDRHDLTANEKLLILQKAYEFNTDNKQRDAIVNNYLCFNQDKPEDRQIILPFLLQTIQTIPTNTFENYVLKCNVDSTNKVEVIKKILQLDINISFYHNLLSKYISSVVDIADVKNKIILLLIEKGLKLDPKTFGQYVCNAPDSPEIKIKVIKLLQKNGCQLKSDTLNNYLVELSSFDKFNPDLFMLLLGDANVITDDAMRNYLLYCKDRDAAKAKNVEMLSKKLDKAFGSSLCKITHLGKSIDCNLLQAYVLLSTDSFEVSNEIVKQILSCKVKINSEMRIDSDGTNVKLKKYVLTYKEQLSPITDKLCKTHKVYSVLF